MCYFDILPTMTKHEVDMPVKVVRMIIPDDLLKKYKVLCVQQDLSLPKQTIELIKKFVEIQENNNEKLRSIKK